jgi:nitric oxide reductase subunit C
MLTKSQARAFFVAGTVLCGVAFVGLTLDTFQRIPEQTRENEITEEVARGKELWERSNCMGCHTLFGEGAYYAPELTRVVERRGEPFVRAMLLSPEAMYPGERKMQDYGFTEEEAADLVAFLRWCGRVDLNGFPADPPLMPPAASGAATATDGRPPIFDQVCVACHSLRGKGGQVGPALDGVGLRLTPDELHRWLEDPLAFKPGARMPKLPLEPQQIDELARFLGEQKEQSP